MANRSYLSTTDQELIYPSFCDPNYDPDAQTVAQGVYCVPLLWLGLFRDADMRTQDFKVEGDTVTVVTPIVASETAVAQLRESAPLFDQMFPGGNFGEYAELLAEAVTATGRKYVTIEMEEIACMDEPMEFYEACGQALQALSGSQPLSVGREKLVMISEIDPKLGIPAANCLLDGAKASDDAIDTHTRIIGCRWVRDVPWE